MIYIVITFIETPEWCINNPKITDPVNCQDNNGIYYNSGLPKIPRLVSLPLDLLILVMLIIFKLIGRLYKHHNKASMRLERI